MTAAHPLDNARRHLAGAKRALREMNEAQTFDDVESAWRSFLHELERVWTKVELRGREAGSKFQPWLGKRAQARKKDPLLRYLHHARNSDEHTLTELTARHPGSIAINAAPGSTGLHIRSMTIRGDGTIHYDGSPAEVTYIAPRLELLKVFDRGDWYNPPTQHLGKPIERVNPSAVAELGLSYYSALVEEVEAKFFPRGA